jgi:CubicO group peptidase (beta-lactamase class C family)
MVTERKISKIIAVFISIFLFASTVWAQSNRLNIVEKSIQEHIKAGDFLGISVAYIAPDGKVSFLSKGKMSKQTHKKVNKNTIYEIGSVTKLFTALAVADVIKEQGISLDRPVEELLPPGWDLPEFSGTPITLQHLLTHTSGLPKSPSNLSKSSSDPYRNYSYSDFCSYLKEVELKEKPGSSFRYSNTGMGLAGIILEEQLDKSYSKIIRDRILEPLDMQNTGINIPKMDSSWLASGYMGNNETAKWHFKSLAGAGALRSTTKDLTKFLQAYLGNRNSDIDSSINITQQVYFTTKDEAKHVSQVGLGWLFSTRHSRIAWHNGATGGFRSSIGLNKEKGSAVVILGNTSHPVADLGLHLLDDSYPIKEVQKRIALSKKELWQFTGEYKVTDNISYYVSLLDKQLYFRVSGQKKIPFYPKSRKRFFCKIIPAEISFSKGKNGRVNQVTLHQNGRNISAKKVK